MISLNPPYEVIGGYTVLADHADPHLFYVLPPAPALAQTADGRPAFSLVQYLGGGAGSAKVAGGLLTLTTELRVPDEALAMLRERLSRPGVEGTPRPPGDIQVTPVLFDSGTVELIALGVTSGVPTPDAAPAPGGATAPAPAPLPDPAGRDADGAGPFAVRFLGSGKPSLGGANEASFQLVLDAMAADLVEQALNAPELPLIAIYRLTFAGLRPSFAIKIEADWRKVYHSLQNKAQANIYFVAANAETLVSRALEENHITIDTTVFGAGESAGAAAERARKQLVDWVLQRLFVPLADPQAATANAIGQVIDDSVWSLARSVLPGVSYRLRQLDDEQVRLMAARMEEAMAEPREVVPQGTLGGLLYHYRLDAQGQPRPDWPALRDTLVQKINLDGFPRLDVEVGAEDRFAADGLAEVRVELARPQPDLTRSDNQTFAFRNATARQHYVVNLLGQTPARFDLPYQYRTEVQFDPAGPFGPHPPATADWQMGRTTALIVEPRTAYTMREVAVGVAPIFSFAQFPAVTVELRATGEDGPAPPPARLQLTEQQPTATWRFRSFAPQPRPYEVRVTYHREASAGGDIVLPPQQQVDDWLAIPDPLPTKRTLNLFAALPWSEIAVAFVQVRYRDEAHGIRFDEQIDLTPDTRYLRRDYPIAAGGPPTLAYRLTLLLASGPLLEGSWRDTDDDRLLIDRRLVERRLITVRAIGGSLAENRLAEVQIQLQVPDPAGGPARAETELRLTPATESQPLPPWEVLLGDPPARTIRYSALFIDTNGFTTRTPEATTEADLLVVQLRNKTIKA